MTVKKLPRNWYTTSEVAVRLGVGRARVNALVREGAFPHVASTPGGGYLIPEEDIAIVEKYRSAAPWKHIPGDGEPPLNIKA